MSTAAKVPETWELTGDDARRTLASVGRRRLLGDAFRRLRVADGFSHARSLAYTMALVLLQGIIALVGLASATGNDSTTDVVIRILRAAAPGAAGDVLVRAVRHAHDAGASHQYLGLTFGLVGALVVGSTMMGQIERGMNRLYGVEQDRSSVRKYGQAFVLTVSAGVLATGASVALAFGREIGASIDNAFLARSWAVVRWPLALVLMMSAMALLFRWAPRRRQPAWSWLAFGSTVSVTVWFVATITMASLFRASGSFGDTYGPLAGVIALLLWSLFSSLALLFGAAVAAQLEAVRAGQPQPQDPYKVTESEPEGTRDDAPALTAS
jgi:YihY family inner membrane protein